MKTWSAIVRIGVISLAGISWTFTDYLPGAPKGDGSLDRTSRLHMSAGETSGLTYHGGKVMATTSTYAIFWLPPLYHFEPTGDDVPFYSLIMQFLSDIGGSTLYNILPQYTYSSAGTLVDGGPILNSSGLAGVTIDQTVYPRSGTQDDPILNSDVLDEVNRVTVRQGWPRDVHSIFFVFTAFGLQSCFDTSRSHCTYQATDSTTIWCAWHSESDPSTIFAYIPDAVSLPGCSLPTSPNRDLASDSAINWMSHELFEGVTDPFFDAWYAKDAAGEIGDQCDWRFGKTLADGSNVDLNNHPYLLQEEWSNRDSGCALSSLYTPPLPTPTAVILPSVTPSPVPMADSGLATGPSQHRCKRGFRRLHGKCRHSR